MRELGDDIVLLAIKPDGALGAAAYLRVAVAGAQLVRLVADRRVDIVDKKIAVLDPGPTGDPLLDAALAELAAGPRPVAAKNWVKGADRRVVEKQLRQLSLGGTVRGEDYKKLGVFPRTRWYAADVSRVYAARARLDAVARSEGPVGCEQFALGGIVHAISLDKVLYPRGEGRPLRRRLALLALADGPEAGLSGSFQPVDDAALRASVEAAVQACVQAVKALVAEASAG